MNRQDIHPKILSKHKEKLNKTNKHYSQDLHPKILHKTYFLNIFKGNCYCTHLETIGNSLTNPFNCYSSTKIVLGGNVDMAISTFPPMNILCITAVSDITAVTRSDGRHVYLEGKVHWPYMEVNLDFTWISTLSFYTSEETGKCWSKNNILKFPHPYIIVIISTRFSGSQRGETGGFESTRFSTTLRRKTGVFVSTRFS